MINNTSVLFISHSQQRCGVYQYGLNISQALTKSAKYRFLYAECSSSNDLFTVIDQYVPAAIIYNYYPSTMPWLTKKLTQRITIPQVGILHEITQQAADTARSRLFQYHIAPDPTLLLKNPIVFKTGRLIPAYSNTYRLPDVPTIGSFGFGTQGKGFEKLIELVQKEFDEAIIRLHIPYAAFGDPNGSAAQAIARHCRDLLVKPGIELTISHDFIDKGKLLDFLAQNTVNAFLYEENQGRGISSVIDYALAVQRPIAITKSNMFRHIISTQPSICVEDSSLRQIIHNGCEPLIHYFREWCEDNIIWDYERIIQHVLDNRSKLARRNLIFEVPHLVRSLFRYAGFNRGNTAQGEAWTPKIDARRHHVDESQIEENHYVSLPNVTSFNRILDNAARDQYKPVIDALFDFVPDMMSRKIRGANIQQAFVLDTVYKFASALPSPCNILCIGSYDDTAAASLKKLGFSLDEVDPVLNYDLDTFFKKPTTRKASYNIIFSTSVIEHVNNDALFVKQIQELLAPEGVSILTCDFNDQYSPGGCLPREDFRLYTRKDFNDRLLPLLTKCSLVDEPRWECTNPDFTYAGCKYTFATVVFKKNHP